MEAMSTPDASSEWDLTVPMTTPSCWPSIVATAFASPLQNVRTGRPEMRAGLMGTCRSLSIHVTRCVHVRHLGQEVNNIVILLAGTSKH